MTREWSRREWRAVSTRTLRLRTECIFFSAMELCSRMIWRCSSRMVRCRLMASSYAATSREDFRAGGAAAIAVG